MLFDGVVEVLAVVDEGELGLGVDFGEDEGTTESDEESLEHALNNVISYNIMQ